MITPHIYTKMQAQKISRKPSVYIFDILNQELQDNMGATNIIKKYITNENRDKIGMLVAAKLNNEIIIGYSSVHPKDLGLFDKEFAYNVAMNRALVYNNRIPRYIPNHIREALPYFVNRCSKYYKTDQIPNWVKNFI